MLAANRFVGLFSPPLSEASGPGKLSLGPNVHPRMHMRISPEIPKHVRTLQLPNIPDAVVSDIRVFVKRHRQRFRATIRANVLHRLVAVLLTIGMQQVGEHLIDKLPLITANL
jgi:hypothetical protein